MRVNNKGTVELVTAWGVLRIIDVSYIRRLAINLFSISHASARGAGTIFLENTDGVCIKFGGAILPIHGVVHRESVLDRPCIAR